MRPKPCPGCSRSRRSCWESPCIHLRILLRGSLSRLAKWVAAGGGRLIANG